MRVRARACVCLRLLCLTPPTPTPPPPSRPLVLPPCQRALYGTSPEEAHLHESRAVHWMASTADNKEGVDSFLEKRAPDFKVSGAPPLSPVCRISTPTSSMVHVFLIRVARARVCVCVGGKHGERAVSLQHLLAHTRVAHACSDDDATATSPPSRCGLRCCLLLCLTSATTYPPVHLLCGVSDGPVRGAAGVLPMVALDGDQVPAVEALDGDQVSPGCWLAEVRCLVDFTSCGVLYISRHVG